MSDAEYPLAGKVAYVTGAARGQGRSHCPLRHRHPNGQRPVDVTMSFKTIRTTSTASHRARCRPTHSPRPERHRDDDAGADGQP